MLKVYGTHDRYQRACVAVKYKKAVQKNVLVFYGVFESELKRRGGGMNTVITPKRVSCYFV